MIHLVSSGVGRPSAWPSNLSPLRPPGYERRPEDFPKPLKNRELTETGLLTFVHHLVQYFQCFSCLHNSRVQSRVHSDCLKHKSFSVYASDSDHMYFDMVLSPTHSRSNLNYRCWLCATLLCPWVPYSQSARWRSSEGILPNAARQLSILYLRLRSGA